jgi:hypothetical protein
MTDLTHFESGPRLPPLNFALFNDDRTVTVLQTAVPRSLTPDAEPESDGFPIPEHVRIRGRCLPIMQYQGLTPVCEEMPRIQRREHQLLWDDDEVLTTPQLGTNH